MGIAEAAVSAPREHRPLAHAGQIGEQGLAVLLIDLGARRHLEDDVLAVCAMAILAHAGAAILRLEVLLVAVVDQRIEPIDRERDDIAALSPIAAVRSAELDEFLTPERHAAVPAVARANVNLGFVEEFHCPRNMRWQSLKGEGLWSIHREGPGRAMPH